jgi:DNA-directed RNA polymerase subunit K/omega
MIEPKIDDLLAAVETGFSNKPLSIALEEIAQGKVTYERSEEPEDD